MLLDMSSNSHQEQQDRRVRQINSDFPGCKLLTDEENQILRHVCDSSNYQARIPQAETSLNLDFFMRLACFRIYLPTVA